VSHAMLLCRMRYCVFAFGAALSHTLLLWRMWYCFVAYGSAILGHRLRLRTD
jgi:hypothetical protein